MTQLIDLPNELLGRVAEMVSSTKDLKSLCLTCSRFRFIGEKVLYAHIYVILEVGYTGISDFRSWDIERIRRLLCTIIVRPQLASYIQSVTTLHHATLQRIGSKSHPISSIRCGEALENSHTISARIKSVQSQAGDELLCKAARELDTSFTGLGLEPFQDSNISSLHRFYMRFGPTQRSYALDSLSRRSGSSVLPLTFLDIWTFALKMHQADAHIALLITLARNITQLNLLSGARLFINAIAGAAGVPRSAHFGFLLGKLKSVTLRGILQPRTPATDWVWHLLPSIRTIRGITIQSLLPPNKINYILSEGEVGMSMISIQPLKLQTLSLVPENMMEGKLANHLPKLLHRAFPMLRKLELILHSAEDRAMINLWKTHEIVKRLKSLTLSFGFEYILEGCPAPIFEEISEFTELTELSVDPTMLLGLSSAMSSSLGHQLPNGLEKLEFNRFLHYPFLISSLLDLSSCISDETPSTLPSLRRITMKDHMRNNLTVTRENADVKMLCLKYLAPAFTLKNITLEARVIHYCYDLHYCSSPMSKCSGGQSVTDLQL